MLSGRTGVLTGVLLGICFSPLTNLAKGYYGGQVKCICLILLLVLALRFPMHLQDQSVGMQAADSDLKAAHLPAAHGAG